jgi:Mrp family chromosome partitioning ATPase
MDFPAMCESSDVRTASGLLDAVIMVIEAGRTTIDDIGEGLEILRQCNAKVIGVILNKVPKRDWPVLLRS